MNTIAGILLSELLLFWKNWCRIGVFVILLYRYFCRKKPTWDLNNENYFNWKRPRTWLVDICATGYV